MDVPVLYQGEIDRYVHNDRVASAAQFGIVLVLTTVVMLLVLWRHR